MDESVRQAIDDALNSMNMYLDLIFMDGVTGPVCYVLIGKDNPFMKLAPKPHSGIYVLVLEKAKGRWFFQSKVPKKITEQELEEAYANRIKESGVTGSMNLVAKERSVYGTIITTIAIDLIEGMGEIPVFTDDGYDHEISFLDPEEGWLNVKITKRGSNKEINHSLKEYAPVGSRLFVWLHKIYGMFLSDKPIEVSRFSEFEVGQRWYDKRYADYFTITEIESLPDGQDVRLTMKYDKGREDKLFGTMFRYDVENGQYIPSKEQPSAPEQPAQIEPIKERGTGGPKYNVGDYVKYKTGDIEIQTWYGRIAEVKYFDSSSRMWHYGVDAFTKSNKYPDAAQNNERAEASLLPISKEQYLNHLKEWELKHPTKYDSETEYQTTNPSDQKEPWQMTRGEFVSQTELFNHGYSPESNKQPKINTYSEGDYSIDIGDDPYVYKFEMVNPNEIDYTEKWESEESVLQRPEVKQYIEWYKQGLLPSPITVVYNQPSQSYKSTNRRRLLAARAAGIKEIPAFVEIGKHKDLIRQALSEGESVPAEVLAEYPELSQETQDMTDEQLIDVVGYDLFKALKRNEDMLGEGVVNRRRMIDNARKIQNLDGKPKLLPEHVFEAQQYELGYHDNWEDLKSAVRKGGYAINKDNIDRITSIGIELPEEILSATRPERIPVIKSVHKFKSSTSGDAYDFVRGVQTYSYEVTFEDGTKEYVNAVDREEAKQKAYQNRGISPQPEPTMNIKVNGDSPNYQKAMAFATKHGYSLKDDVSYNGFIKIEKLIEGGEDKIEIQVYDGIKKDKPPVVEVLSKEAIFGDIMDETRYQFKYSDYHLKWDDDWRDIRTVDQALEYAVKLEQNIINHNKPEPAMESENVRQGFTNGSTLIELREKVLKRYGQKEGNKILAVVNRLVNPNRANIIDINSNGVVFKEGDKYIKKMFGNTDAHISKWVLYDKPYDVTDQYSKLTKPAMDTRLSELYSKAGTLRFTLNALEMQMGYKGLQGKAKAEYDRTESELRSVEAEIGRLTAKPQQQEAPKPQEISAKEMFSEPVTETGIENPYALYLLDLIDKRHRENHPNENVVNALARQYKETEAERGESRAISNLESIYVVNLPIGTEAGAYQMIRHNFEKMQKDKRLSELKRRILIEGEYVNPDELADFPELRAKNDKNLKFEPAEPYQSQPMSDEEGLSKGIEVEQEHKGTLEEVASGAITPEQGVEKIAKDHLKESKLYYSETEGLPALEEHLANIERYQAAIDGLEVMLSMATRKEAKSYTEAIEALKIMLDLEHEHGQKFEHGGIVQLRERVTKQYTFRNGYDANMYCQSILKKKEYSERRDDYTHEELYLLSRYDGMGGHEKHGAKGPGIFYEYYTPDDIILKMWGLAIKHGFEYGTDKLVVEPSCGTGRFFKYASKKDTVVGIEMDINSATIAKLMYPHVTVLNLKYERLFIRNNRSIKRELSRINFDYGRPDLIIGNPPYGEIGGFEMGMGEEDYAGEGHKDYVTYFINRSYDLLRHGGLLVFIVGTAIENGGTLWLDKHEIYTEKEESSYDEYGRWGKHLIKFEFPKLEVSGRKWEVLDAYRLPAGVFDRTEVTSDIIVLRKV